MIVVSNTSPLTNLAAIGQFGVLSVLYHEIHIANAVWDELNAGGQRWPGGTKSRTRTGSIGTVLGIATSSRD